MSKQFKIKRGYHKIILISGFLLILIFFALKLSNLQQLPGPPFGGDIYRNNGMILNILEKGHPFSSSYFNDASAYYSWLPFVIIALMTFLGIPLLVSHVVIYPLIQITIALLIFNYCSNYFFKNKILSAASALFMTAILTLGYSHIIIMPALLLLFVVHFLKVLEEKKKTKSDIYAGITLGIISLVRFSEFFTMIIVTSLFLFARFVYKERKLNKEITFEYTKKYWRLYAFAIGIACLMLIPILFVHQFKTFNLVYQYAGINYEVLTFSWMFTALKNTVFNYSSFTSFMYSTLTLLGIISTFIVKGYKKYRTLIFFFYVPIILSQHYHITKPLFNKWFLPDKLMVYGYLTPVFIILGLLLVVNLLSRIDNLKKIKKYSTIIVTIIVVLLFFHSFNNRINSLDNDKWYQYGLNNDPQIQAYEQLAVWIKDNVGEDEVILAGDETSFMINGFTGKKVVSSRRTHVSYYVDIEQRVADTAVIFYGNNNELRSELIDKYNIKYLYYDFYFQSLPMRTIPEHSEYLRNNGVIITPVRDRLDIAYEKAKVFDLILIPPQNISQDLLNRVDPLFEVKVENQRLGFFFKFKE